MTLLNMIRYAIILSLLVLLSSCTEEILTAPALPHEKQENMKPTEESSTKSETNVFLMFHKGGTNQQFYVQKYDETANRSSIVFDTEYEMPSNFRSKIAPEAFVHNNEVFLYWKGERNGTIYVSKASIDDAENGNGSGWTSPRVAVSYSFTDREPTVTRYRGRFYMFYMGGGRISYHISNDGLNWGPLNQIQRYNVGNTGRSTNNDLINNHHHKLSVVMIENRLYCFFVGHNDTVKYISATLADRFGNLTWQVPQENGTFIPSVGGIQTRVGLSHVKMNSGKIYLVFSNKNDQFVTTKSCYVDRPSDGKLRFGSNTRWTGSRTSAGIGVVNDDNDRLIIVTKDLSNNRLFNSSKNVSNSTIWNQEPILDFNSSVDGLSTDGLSLVLIR